MGGPPCRLSAVLLLVLSLLALLLPALSSPVLAQEAGATPLPEAARQAAADPELLDICLSLHQGAVARSGCIGLVAARCAAAIMPAAPVEVAACAAAERDLWQDRLDAAQASLREMAADTDAASGMTGEAGRAAALAAADTAWRAFRDAECARARADAAGSGAEDVAAAECETALTAQRALRLEGQRRAALGP